MFMSMTSITCLECLADSASAEKLILVSGAPSQSFRSQELYKNGQLVRVLRYYDSGGPHVMLLSVTMPSQSINSRVQFILTAHNAPGSDLSTCIGYAPENRLA